MFQEAEFKKAGKIAGQARDYGASLITQGASVREILDAVEAFILSKKARIAFPAQISLNTIAAHSCSAQDDETIIQPDDLVKLDVGAHVNGHIGDTAISVNLSGQHQELLNASKQALKEASKLFTPGTPVGEIGKTIQDVITSRGFTPVRNLSGHGLGLYQIHTAPQIPNIYLKESMVLTENMTVACEPFATNGKGAIAEHGEATVFTQVSKKPIRSAFAREVLKTIQTYDELPFTTRWLTKDFGIGKTKLALKELERAGIIQAHPPLKEIGNGLVSQHEHTFLVRDSPIITTKQDE